MLPAVLLGAALIAGIALVRQLASLAESRAGRIVGWSVMVLSGLGLLALFALVVIVWLRPMHQ